ncbi:hypothetical protein ZEAMMB73_Zm00001d037535 [Zea mays]|uniref:Uncharacterized protein n=1 Tax=Zea mays TaxID=4577 RepID=A0A1D6LYL5_MAIZE|nr:hypothetical protein ZEAMMB73_Zm00001d037535 [Zea mays]
MEELGSRSYKAHKNNIKKPTCGCQTSTKGVTKSRSKRDSGLSSLHSQSTLGLTGLGMHMRSIPLDTSGHVIFGQIIYFSIQSRASLATFSDLSQSQCEVHRADEGDSYAEYSSGEKTKIGINVSMNKVEAWYMLFKKIGNTFIDDGLMMG